MHDVAILNEIFLPLQTKPALRACGDVDRVARSCGGELATDPARAADGHGPLMPIWVVGRGIVGSRVERMLADHDVRIHDPRVEPTPLVDSGDVAVLAHPVDHAPLARAFALRGASVVTVGDGLVGLRVRGEVLLERHGRRQPAKRTGLPGRLAAGLRGDPPGVRCRRRRLAGSIQRPGRQLGIQSPAQRCVGRKLWRQCHPRRRQYRPVAR